MKNLLILCTTLLFLAASCKGPGLLPKEEIIPCIDESKINPNAGCPRNYAPVCGCNGKTYSNSCAAEKEGLNSWKEGKCPE